ncbi:MAG: YdcH family protein [Acidobacteria bacterium]|nr:YdcH family protein [Acidobacteriota bacterium]
MTDTEETRRQLLDSNYAFRQLSTEHHSLDDRLKLLAGKPHLTDDEQLEEVRLKKEKLRLKDQMEAFMRRHQSPLGTAPA